MIRIPQFKEPRLTDTLVAMDQEHERTLANKLSSDRANHSLLLQSPGGKVYEVTVSDAGVLVITLVAG